MHLLALDDDPQIGRLLANIAMTLDWTVDAVTTAAAFQRALQDTTPDAVILDLQLGISDGVEQLRFLHAAQYRNPVVLMSGFDDRVLATAEQLGESLGLVMAGVLRKPASVASVREVLQHIRDRHAPLTPSHIEEALNRGEMSIDLQPIVAADTWRVHHLEALLRWAHPTRGAIAPDQFIPTAEADTALIERLVLWVAQGALDVHDALRREQIAVPVAINVSGANLRDVGFPDALARLTREHDAPSSALLLEITETVATSDPTAMLDILARLRLKGFEVAIDDFGTGYSSLLALHRLPFNELKIDRRFVSGIPGSREALLIVRSVADLARNLGLRTVAEGVETDVAAKTLRDIGVNCLQGFLFSRPLPRAEIAPWLRAWQKRTAGNRVT